MTWWASGVTSKLAVSVALINRRPVRAQLGMERCYRRLVRVPHSTRRISKPRQERHEAIIDLLAMGVAPRSLGVLGRSVERFGPKGSGDTATAHGGDWR